MADTKKRTESTEQSPQPTRKAELKDNEQITCGLIMPIAGNEAGTTEHWLQVRKIISDALAIIGLKVKMVSDSDEVNVIHQNIVTNIYTNEIIVCDVSARNPNVMFELGMRLTFDKPVVIIKDRETPFSFDVGNIQHLEYPRSLNYVEIQKFQQDLCDKVSSTIEASHVKGYSPFLSYYKIKHISELETEFVGRDDYILSAIGEMKSMISAINHNVSSAVIDKNNNSFNEDSNLRVTDASLRIAVKLIENETYDAIIARYNGAPLDNNAINMCREYIDARFSHLPLSTRKAAASRVMDRINSVVDLL
ncbi:hypothetical protein ACET6R_11230 [Aeromonas veronii]